VTKTVIGIIQKYHSAFCGLLSGHLRQSSDQGISREFCPGDCNDDGISAEEELVVALSLLFDSGRVHVFGADGHNLRRDAPPVGATAPLITTVP
jgi:hypothetical protein